MITAIAPHTRIDNDIIDADIPKMGTIGFAIFVVLKRHLNQKTGDCYPSYKTIARKVGIDRSTVIRYVKKLTALHLVSPELRFKEDGSPSSNQYDLQKTGHAAPAKNQAAGNAVPAIIQAPDDAVPTKKTTDSVQKEQDSGSEPPPLVAENHHPGGTVPPEQVFSSNMKKRTMTEVDVLVTEKQKTCPHPPELIVMLPDNITICNHCYGLLDANLQLITKHCPTADTGRMHTEESPPEKVAA